MDSEQQILVRIKAFLNSSDLTDSQTAKDLYATFLELNNRTAQRLVECDVLLQKKQKIEAVVLAQQKPAVLDMVQSLQFPERKLLLELVELYDWRMPDELNPQLIYTLQKALSGMEDLRPLLIEYRRLARTSQVKNKLLLLRRIVRLDVGNQEWRLPLEEMENKYLSQIIEEAQRSIIEKNFEKLESINDELLHSEWTVSLPSIVLQKIDKILTAHRQEEAKKTAAVLLDRIDTAYGAFDVPALEDALLCWQRHCADSQYVPNDNERRRIEEAETYLRSELEKQRKQQEFQDQLDHLLALLDTNAPLTEVERDFSSLEKAELPVPDYLCRRVRLYRKDQEREQRAALLLKISKVVSISAITAAILIGSSVLLIRYFYELKQSEQLFAALKKGNIAEAQVLLADLEKNHPELRERPRISKARGILRDLENKEAERVQALNRNIEELRRLQKIWPPDKRIAQLLAASEKLAVTSVEHTRLQEIQQWKESADLRLERDSEDAFLVLVDQIRQSRDKALEWIRGEKFVSAEKELAELEKRIEAAKKLPAVRKELLADHGELLNANNTVRNELLNAQTQKQRRTEALQTVARAENFSALEDAAGLLAEIIKNSGAESDKIFIRQLQQDIGAFRIILDGKTDEASDAAPKSGYIADVKTWNAYTDHLQTAYTEMGKLFDNLWANQRTPLYYICLNASKSEQLHFYVTKQMDRRDNEIFLQQHNGKNLKIVRLHSSITDISCDVYLNDEDRPSYRYCKLVIPEKRLELSDIRRSRAVHQKLIKDFFDQHPKHKPQEILSVGINYLRQIYHARYCSPYWKMQLSLRIVELLAPLDLSADAPLKELLKQLQMLKESDTDADSLGNQYLADQILRFFGNYKIAVWDALLESNRRIARFLQAAGERKFQYLGIAIRVNDQLIQSMAPSLQQRSGLIWIFDDKGSGCLIVGRFKAGQMIFDPEFRDKAFGRLLFTSVDGEEMSQLQELLKIKNKGFDPENFQWPAFWPQNRRGN